MSQEGTLPFCIIRHVARSKSLRGRSFWLSRLNWPAISMSKVFWPNPKYGLSPSMQSNPAELTWNAVELIILSKIEEQRVVRVFERHPNLAYKEYWIIAGCNPRFVGINDPPDSGERVHLSGESA